MTKYTVKPTTQFKKDYKLAIKRGLKIELLEEIIISLANGVPLPEKNKDHALGGNWNIVSVTSYLIGYLYIGWKMMFLS